MTSPKTDALATRIPAERAERVQEVVEHTDLSKSDLLGRALRYYIEMNPDEMPPFQPRSLEPGPLEEAGILSPANWDQWAGLRF